MSAKRADEAGQPTSPTTSASPSSQAADSRAPYEPPRFEVEELFEVVALSCGKIRPTLTSCLRSPRVS